MKPSRSHPAEDLLTILHDLARLTGLEADRRARQHGMTRAQWALLVKLSRHPGLSQTELAELLEAETMSVVRLTNRLEARGFVERRADPQDRRIWRLYLTPAAQPILGIVEKQRAAIAALVTRDLPSVVIAAMVEDMRQMKATLLSAQDSDPSRPLSGQSPSRCRRGLARSTP